MTSNPTTSQDGQRDATDINQEHDFEAANQPTEEATGARLRGRQPANTGNNGKHAFEADNQPTLGKARSHGRV